VARTKPFKFNRSMYKAGAADISEGDPEAAQFLKSDIGGAALARNPSAYPNVAAALQLTIDRKLGNKRGFANPKSSGDDFLPDTTYAFDFYNEQQALRQEYSGSEIDRQFGQQGVISTSSTVNADGTRKTIGGQDTSTTPTNEQRDAISSSYMTPFELLVADLPSNPATSPAPATLKARTPTIVTGAGVGSTKRRFSQKSSGSTILSSDASLLTGKNTILG